MSKNKFNLSWKTVSSIFSILIAAAGLVISLCRIEAGAVIALSICALFLLAVLLEITVAIVKILKVEGGKEGYRLHFDFMYYEEKNDKDHSFDSYSGIQCKRPFLNSIMYKYDWSGTRPPTNIKSELQKTGKNVPGNKTALNPEDRFDRKELILEMPILYNQVTMLHFHADLWDGDQKSQPCLSYRIEDSISFILFKVTLLNRANDFNEDACLYKVPFNENLDKEKHIIGKVEFDKVTKSYEHNLPNPELGYTYYLYWKKNK